MGKGVVRIKAYALAASKQVVAHNAYCSSSHRFSSLTTQDAGHQVCRSRRRVSD